MNSSDEDFVAVSSDSSEDEEVAPLPVKKNKVEKIEDPLLKELLKVGVLQVDNIHEIQYILKAIHECNADPTLKQQMGLCFNMLISLSNQYLKIHKEL